MLARQNKRVLIWLALAAICFSYLLFVWRLHPENFFGVTHDDMIYFNSAKALAEGKGYVHPNLPGTPPATKYPVLYPWLLSWVWRYNPSFPANLKDAIWLNSAFGILFILSCYHLLRGVKDLTRTEAVCLTGYCTLHPVFLFYSGVLLAEIPFAALSLAGLILADIAVHRKRTIWLAGACGFIFGLSILLRTAGVPLAIGIILVAVLRRAWRQALAFGGCFSPFLVALLWRSVISLQTVAMPTNAATAPNWQQAWSYYTDYVAFRKMSSPNLHMVWTFAINQILYLPSQVAGYFLSPFSRNHVVFWFSTTLLISWAVVTGLVRQARSANWSPVYVSGGLYILIFFTWNFPDWERFLLLFLPVISVALWTQGKRWIFRIVTFFRSARFTSEKFAAASALFLLATLLLTIFWNYVGPSRASAKSLSLQRALLLPEKKEAYLWLERNSQTHDRVIALEDGCVFLYTHRQAMPPMIASPADIYDPLRLKSELDHMLDVAKTTQAGYWLDSSDDSEQTFAYMRPFVAARSTEIKAVLPLLFRSSAGHVQIFGLGCVQTPETPECQSVAPILFPFNPIYWSPQ